MQPASFEDVSLDLGNKSMRFWSSEFSVNLACSVVRFVDVLSLLLRAASTRLHEVARALRISPRPRGSPTCGFGCQRQSQSHRAWDFSASPHLLRACALSFLFLPSRAFLCCPLLQRAATFTAPSCCTTCPLPSARSLYSISFVL